MKIEIEVTGCSDCPSLRKGKTYGNDGRDGWLVYICEKGAFGGRDGLFYDYGETRIPKVPPVKCPYFNSHLIDRVADGLNVKVKDLKEILDLNKCELIDKR